MPIQSLPIGYPTLMLQNVIYACPARLCTMYCDVAAATFEMSNTSTMILATAVTLDANEQIDVAGSFIRSTAGNANVVFKAN